MIKLPSRVHLGMDRFSGLYIWALFIITFGIWTPRLFLSFATVQQITSQQALTGLVALAALVPLTCGAYDLSIGANVNICAVTVTVLQVQDHYSMWPAILLSVAIGAVIGIVNGVIVVILKVNSFIATLGTATILTAVQTIVSGGVSPLSPAAHAWSSLTQREIWGIQIIFLYLVVAALIIWWMMAWTPVGRYIDATGSNIEAARLSGVGVGRWTMLSLLISGTLCGLTGVFYSSLIGPSLTFGNALLLPAFAAAFLGATQFRPGRFNVGGTMLAVFVLATGVLGLQLVTSVQWLNDMFNGVALVSAVAFAGWRQRAKRKASREISASDSRGPGMTSPDGRPATESKELPALGPINVPGSTGPK
jgi:ribose transport system permease protein